MLTQQWDQNVVAMWGIRARDNLEPSWGCFWQRTELDRGLTLDLEICPTMRYPAITR